VTVLDSRPDPEYIRSLARGDDPPKGIPARLRGTCPLCAGPAADRERRRPGGGGGSGCSSRSTMRSSRRRIPGTPGSRSEAGGPVHVIEVTEGELLEKLEAAAKEAGITDAAIVMPDRRRR